MKTLFRAFFSAAAVAMISLSTFTACTSDEEYELFFEMPGQITTELNKTLVVPFNSRNITSITVTSYPNGWTIENVDLVEKTITITSPKAYTVDNSIVKENGELVLLGYTAAGTSVRASSYLSLLNQQLDISDQYSNCYVLTQKDTRYTIDLTHKGESGERISPASAEVIWQSSVGLIDHYSLDEATGKFTFYVDHEDITNDDGDVVGTRIPDGNGVVAAYDAEGNVLWSWHIWLTGSDLESTAINTSVGVFMDRNLGAYHNSDGSTKQKDIFRSYGLYYQWGRKDPFARPMDYKFSSNSDQIVYNGVDVSIGFKYVNADTNTEVGTESYVMANPMSYVLGSANNDYDWIYTSHDNTLWDASSPKSVNDPCPRGWRVPDGSVFEAFDIDEAEDLDEVANMKDMYGWHLVDKATGVRMFMPAAGRRSFENGKLTNLNNYGLEHNPMPWVGYYWTAGVNGAQATSLYFDLNTTRAVNNIYQPTKPMYRANAMQIRCVKE